MTEDEVRQLAAAIEAGPTAERVARLEAAATESAHAKRELASLVMSGVIERPYDDAVRWLTEAAAGGDPEAMYLLALEMESPFGASIPGNDPGTVVALYQRAADAGYGPALTNLAWCHHVGFGVPVDLEGAHALWSAAAATGDETAFANLGRDYERGLGVAPDPERARAWYHRAAAAGHVGATLHLAELRLEDSDDSAEHARAVALLEAVLAGETASLDEVAFAAHLLACAYEVGRGAPVDLDRAHALFRQAAELGRAEAQVDLGYLLFNGEGMAPDPVKAVALYRRAAARGNLSAMYNLGVAYEEGEGVPRDLDVAREWYRRAADAGHEAARESLERLDGRV